MVEYLLIDGKDKIMGRLAAHVAKLALLGQRVLVKNAQDIVISGNKSSIFGDYEELKHKKTRSNPRAGPFFYRRPDAIFRRTVRGMLPFKQARGKEAFRRIHACLGEPDTAKYPRLVEQDAPDCHVDRLQGKFITLGVLGQRFGWKSIGV